uniref:Uncharacterized protein n=1 Tax=Lactuca sativa TaxID=4236 RepID=A0A9R1UI28_LACSA|nr:hypothetical protein LSAT_V11C900491220 [Lactuca sativa]
MNFLRTSHDIDHMLNVDKCFLQSEVANKNYKNFIFVVQDCWRNHEVRLSPYDCHSHDGFMNHLMIKSGSLILIYINYNSITFHKDVDTRLPQLMVNFTTSSYKPELLNPLVDKLSVNIMNNVNTLVGNTYVTKKEYTINGKATIDEMLRGLSFEISANSFYQTNEHLAEILYKLVEDCAGLKVDVSEKVLDLFCRTGTIGLTLAKKYNHLSYYHINKYLLNGCTRSAKLSGLHNDRFIQGDLNKRFFQENLDIICEGLRVRNHRGFKR